MGGDHPQPQQQQQHQAEQLTWARSIRKNLRAVTESRKHQLDFRRPAAKVLATVGRAAEATPSSGPWNLGSQNVSRYLIQLHQPKWMKMTHPCSFRGQFHETKLSKCFLITYAQPKNVEKSFNKSSEKFRQVELSSDCLPHEIDPRFWKKPLRRVVAYFGDFQDL